MSTTYTPALSLGKPAMGDTAWNVPLNATIDALDALAPIGGLAVTPTEIPSTTLNVKVAAGNYRKSSGAVGSYAGTTSRAIAASSTKVLYLDSSGTLQVASAYPTSGAHVRLASIVTGTSSITSITDQRIAAVEIGSALAAAADDTAAATAGVPIGCFYQDTTGVVRVRLT